MNPGDCGTVLVVDDDEPFRILVSSALRSAGFLVREAESGPEAIEAARAAPPDLVLTDVDLPGLNGYELCRELRDEFGEDLPIAFVTGARTESLDRVAGLLLGADDYLVKPIDPAELVARARRLARRRRGDTAAPTPNGGTERLTVREREVLELLALGRNTNAIAAELFISPKTVSTHLQRILAKLGVHSRAEAVAVAYREGLLADVTAHLLMTSVLA